MSNLTGDNRAASWWFVIVGILLNVAALGFARFAYGVIMPFMMNDMRLSYGQAGLLGTATASGYLSMVMFAGAMTAKWGAKRVVLWGSTLVSLSLLGLGLLSFYAWSFTMMLLAGVGTAMIFTPLVALLVGWFPNKRGVVIGFIGSGAGIGSLLNGYLIPFLIDSFPRWGWRVPWILFGLIACCITLLAAVILRNPPELQKRVGVTRQDAFREVYKKKEVLLVAVIYFFNGLPYMVCMTFLFGFMVERQIDPAAAGQIVALGGLISITSGPVWGYVSDKIGRRLALVVGLAITTVGMLIPVLAPGFLGFLTSQIIIGFTVGGMLSLIQASSTDQVRPVFMGASLGYVTVFFAVGQLLGPGIAGYLIDRVGGFPSAFLFAALMFLIAVPFAMRLRPPAHSPIPVGRTEYQREV
ncbi:MFS transporter [Effusibacillus dendaii]|uniref:MFS transporter n=1 Tax=Effusibacillus dendaii TaxID=2743772 RepID=A0A7I8DBZ1_9BACL|nr:MFS transporter [Effusibacillus dendaii]BCJ86852.1 MFS transporter [Effusibacillus dendaii]